MELPIVRHFLVCLGVEYEWNQPAAPYCLRNLVFRHPSDQGYPLVVPDLWVFVRTDGVGDREFWIEVHRVGEPDRGPAVNSDESLVAAYGPYCLQFGVEPKSFSRGWHLRGVPFPESGWYEFQLITDGELIAREPVYLEG